MGSPGLEDTVCNITMRHYVRAGAFLWPRAGTLCHTGRHTHWSRGFAPTKEVRMTIRDAHTARSRSQPTNMPAQCYDQVQYASPSTFRQLNADICCQVSWRAQWRSNCTSYPGLTTTFGPYTRPNSCPWYRISQLVCQAANVSE